jgi:hypothetical protein
VCVLSQ